MGSGLAMIVLEVGRTAPLDSFGTDGLWLWLWHVLSLLHRRHWQARYLARR